MKVKVALLFLAVIFVQQTLQAQQSIYYFKYHFPQAGDAAIYQAFLVRYEDGTGFIRVSYTDPDNNQPVLVDMEMEEGYETSKKGKVDSSKLYFEGYDPVIIHGDTTAGYNSDIFWFRLNKQNGYFEPWDIESPDDSTGEVDTGEYLESRLLDEKDLTRDFIAQFFDEKDNIFDNFVDTATTRQLTTTDKNTKLFLIIAANTLDPDIGPTCESDRKATESTFKDLTEFLGIKLVSNVIYGNDYSKKNVETAIQSLNPSPNDIVVFYYTGHGFSMTDNHQYPHIALTAKQYESATANSLNMEDIYSRIREKGARFNLILSDCCNSPIDNASAIIPVTVARTRTSQVGWDLDNCKSLFLDPKPSSILMTAASRNELSCGLPAGGLFTQSLRSSLIDYFSKFHNNVSWSEVLTSIKNDTIKRADHTKHADDNGQYIFCKQHPIFKIDIQ